MVVAPLTDVLVDIAVACVCEAAEARIDEACAAADPVAEAKADRAADIADAAEAYHHRCHYLDSKDICIMNPGLPEVSSH